MKDVNDPANQTLQSEFNNCEHCQRPTANRHVCLDCIVRSIEMSEGGQRAMKRKIKKHAAKFKYKLLEDLPEYKLKRGNIITAEVGRSPEYGELVIVNSDYGLQVTRFSKSTNRLSIKAVVTSKKARSKTIADEWPDIVYE